jgi:hypothetical protein
MQKNILLNILSHSDKRKILFSSEQDFDEKRKILIP